MALFSLSLLLSEVVRQHPAQRPNGVVRDQLQQQLLLLLLLLLRASTEHDFN